MTCAECYFYEFGICWSKRSGRHGCRMQPEGSCPVASKDEYTEGGIPWQIPRKEQDNGENGVLRSRAGGSA